MSSPSEMFERAFVATSYFIGRRGADLVEALPAPSPVAQKLAARLAHPEQAVRAQLLAAELGPIIKALEAWKFR